MYYCREKLYIKRIVNYYKFFVLSTCYFFFTKWENGTRSEVIYIFNNEKFQVYTYVRSSFFF